MNNDEEAKVETPLLHLNLFSRGISIMTGILYLKLETVSQQLLFEIRDEKRQSSLDPSPLNAIIFCQSPSFHP
jgi:hypothetical protein